VHQSKSVTRHALILHKNQNKLNRKSAHI